MANELVNYQDHGSSERGLVDIEQGRAIQEVQAAVLMARRFPRDVDVSRNRILTACQRKALAESAMYEYPRGGIKVTGPSIRLAEVCAQAWGNIDFGIRELSQHNGVSEIETFCWDLETNTRQTKTFKVAHKRYTKNRTYDLEDPRDIYEMVANNGARRLRACILGVIPGDIVDEAVQECNKTLKANQKRPTAELILSMIEQFKGFGVGLEMLEKRLGHKLNESTTRTEIVALGKIYNSLKDGMSKPEDWFGEGASESALNESDTNAAAFDRHLKASGYDGNESMQKFIAQTAKNAKKSEKEIKAMAIGEKDRFFKAFEMWVAAEKKKGDGEAKPDVFDRPYTAKPDPMQRDEPVREYPPEADAPPSAGEVQDQEPPPDDDEPKEDLESLYQSDEWNELMALQTQYPEAYKWHIANASYSLKSLRSVQMAINKINSVVDVMDDDIPM